MADLDGIRYFLAFFCGREKCIVNVIGIEFDHVGIAEDVNSFDDDLFDPHASILKFKLNQAIVVRKVDLECC